MKNKKNIGMDFNEFLEENIIENWKKSFNQQIHKLRSFECKNIQVLSSYDREFKKKA